MILHMISKSPFQHAAFDDALSILSGNDAILLIEDGVYAGLTNTSTMQKIHTTGCTCYALTEHAAVRGIALDPTIKAIDIKQMVALTLAADKVISWY